MHLLKMGSTSYRRFFENWQGPCASERTLAEKLEDPNCYNIFFNKVDGATDNCSIEFKGTIFNFILILVLIKNFRRISISLITSTLLVNDYLFAILQKFSQLVIVPTSY